MKDIEWLKNEIEIMGSETIENYPHEQMVEREVVLNLIDQLDEPEVLSHEWIDEHSVAVAYDGIPDQTEIVYVDDLENLLVPKQKLPVIPKFVAKWIEHCKANDLDLYEAFGHSDMSVEVSDLVGDIDADILARAWLDGYEVEEEQRYYAKLKEVHPLEKEWLVNLTPSNYYVISTKGLRFGEFILDLVGVKSNASTYTLESWGRYGINDLNADFVKVKEVAE